MSSIARLIDHTLLRPDATETQVVKLCNEAKQYSFHTVCVNPAFIKTARDALHESHVKVASVIGFPLGMTLPQVKVYEAMQAAMHGADELDVVINIGLAKANKWSAVTKEISDIVSASADAVHKIIIEACYLTDDEKRMACSAVMDGGAAFIKTSTGFGPSGASLKDVKLIKSVIKGNTGIKAAGGIKTLKEAEAFVRAGATRIGTSSGVSMMEERAR